MGTRTAIRSASPTTPGAASSPMVTLEAIGEGVIRTSAAGRVEYMNPAAERLTGWSGEDARRPRRRRGLQRLQRSHPAAAAQRGRALPGRTRPAGAAGPRQPAHQGRRRADHPRHGVADPRRGRRAAGRGGGLPRPHPGAQPRAGDGLHHQPRPAHRPAQPPGFRDLPRGRARAGTPPRHPARSALPGPGRAQAGQRLLRPRSRRRAAAPDRPAAARRGRRRGDPGPGRRRRLQPAAREPQRRAGGGLRPQPAAVLLLVPLRLGRPAPGDRVQHRPGGDRRRPNGSPSSSSVAERPRKPPIRRATGHASKAATRSTSSTKATASTNATAACTGCKGSGKRWPKTASCSTTRKSKRCTRTAPACTKFCCA